MPRADRRAKNRSARDCSLCGKRGSQFWISEWKYPPIGVYFADCPSAGHDMLCLDYRACGPTGEPTVVHVDQEHDYKITFVAPSFESFIRGLEDDAAFQDPEETSTPAPPPPWNPRRIKGEATDAELEALWAKLARPQTARG